MAKIKKLPSKAVIDGFKGTLDFYVHRGISCVRMWPRYDESRTTAATKAARIPFAYISTITKTLPDNIVEAYQALASPTRLTWKDAVIRCYLNGNAVYPNSAEMDWG